MKLYQTECSLRNVGVFLVLNPDTNINVFFGCYGNQSMQSEKKVALTYFSTVFCVIYPLLWHAALDKTSFISRFDLVNSFVDGKEKNRVFALQLCVSTII